MELWLGFPFLLLRATSNITSYLVFLTIKFLVFEKVRQSTRVYVLFVLIKVLLATPPQTQEAANTKVAEAEAKVAAAEAKVAEAVAKVAAAEAKVAAAEAKVAVAEAKVAAAETKVAEAAAQVAEAEAEIKQDPASENWINELKVRSEALKTANEALKRRDEALKTANENLKTAKETLKRREEFFFNLCSKSFVVHSGIRFLFTFSPFFSNFQLVVQLGFTNFPEFALQLMFYLIHHNN